MADDPSKKKPKKGKFPAPELAKNKPAGIPKSYYRSPEAQRMQDRLNTERALWGDEPQYGVDYSHNRRLVTANEQPYPRQIDPSLPDTRFSNPNPFAAPDLGAGMNPFSGHPPPLFDHPSHLPQDAGSLPDAEGQWNALPRRENYPEVGIHPEAAHADWPGLSTGYPVEPPSVIRMPSPPRPPDQMSTPMFNARLDWRELDPSRANWPMDPGGRPEVFGAAYPVGRGPSPDLTVIHPEARDGLIPSKPFLGQYQVGWNENPERGYQQIIDSLPVARQARPTQHLTEYPSHLPTQAAPIYPRINVNPSVVEAADTLGVPTTLPALGAGFALGAGHTLGEMYAPIDTRAFDRALGQTQDTVERFMYPQPVYQGVQAGRELLGRGMTAVGNAANAGGNWLLDKTMQTPINLGGRPIPADFNPQIRLDPFVGRLMAEPVAQQGAGRAKPRKKAKK